MLIRNVTAFVNGCFRDDVEVRVHHGLVHEVGSGLAKGLYEEEIDLRGDFLLPGFVDVCVPTLGGALHSEKDVRVLSRALFREGVAAFCLNDMGAESLRVLERPEHNGARVLRGPAGIDFVGMELLVQVRGEGLSMRQALSELLHRHGLAPEQAVLMCTAMPADAVGEKLAGKIVAGAPAPLSRWSKDWQWKGILA